MGFSALLQIYNLHTNYTNVRMTAYCTSELQCSLYYQSEHPKMQDFLCLRLLFRLLQQHILAYMIKAQATEYGDKNLLDGDATSESHHWEWGGFILMVALA